MSTIKDVVQPGKIRGWTGVELAVDAIVWSEVMSTQWFNFTPRTKIDDGHKYVAVAEMMWIPRYFIHCTLYLQICGFLSHVNQRIIDHKPPYLIVHVNIIVGLDRRQDHNLRYQRRLSFERIGELIHRSFLTGNPCLRAGGFLDVEIDEGLSIVAVRDVLDHIAQ